MNSIVEQLDSQQCRTCYNSKLNLQPLKFVPDSCPQQQAEHKSYGEILTEVCNINLMDDKPTGYWPQFICLPCSQQLKSAYDFIQQTLEINKYLKTIAGQLLVREEMEFIEKPELDIPLEIKIETDTEVDVSANERVFQYSPIERQVVKTETVTTTTQDDEEDDYHHIDDNECEDIPSNNFIVTEIKNESYEIDNELNPIKDATFNDTSDNSPNSSPSLKTPTNKNSPPPPADPKLLMCNICNKLFTIAWRLNHHKRYTHLPEEEKLPCHLCGLKFSRPYHFRRHMETVHAPDKERKCSKCERRFVRPQRLFNHERKCKANAKVT